MQPPVLLNTGLSQPEAAPKLAPNVRDLLTSLCPDRKRLSGPPHTGHTAGAMMDWLAA